MISLLAAEVAHDVPLYASAPFLLILLAIAVLPLWKPHFWEPNRNKAIVALVLGLPVAVYAFVTLRHELAETGLEYLQFMVLLGSLFAVSGGIYLEGDLRATPRVNLTFLAIGAVLASFVGTTGAAMLLIRPLLRTNSQRRRTVHTVVFFVFVVCNTGGCLTPLGDPPLFMGYLQGVPFAWTFGLWPEWLAVNGVLLAIYYVWDSIAMRKETREALRLDATDLAPLRLRGAVNLVLLAGIVAAVAFLRWPSREAAMVAFAVLSFVRTPADIHDRNHFTWHPILEVAILFAGIFATMIPALQYLAQHGRELGLESAHGYFWATGVLSGFLDNTPTYLTFAAAAKGSLGFAADAHLGDLVATVRGAELLRAVSLGAVFMGALTYIGNGPNFMVKAIADARKVRMPSFFGFMAYSVVVLIPVYTLVVLLML